MKEKHQLDTKTGAVELGDYLSCEEIKNVMHNYKGHVCIDGALSLSRIETINAVMGAFQGDLLLGKQCTPDVVEWLDWSKFNGKLWLEHCAPEVIKVLDRKLLSFKGALAFDNQQAALNSLQCSLKDLQCLIHIVNPISKATADALSRKIAGFKGILYLSIKRSTRSIDWLDLSGYTGFLALHGCSDTVIQSINNKLPAFPGKLYLNNEHSASDASKLSLEHFNGAMCLSKELPGPGVKKISQVLPRFKSLLVIESGTRKETFGLLKLKSFGGALYVFDDTLLNEFLPFITDAYLGGLHIGPNVSCKKLTEFSDTVLPMLSGELVLSANAEQYGAIDFKAFKGVLRIISLKDKDISRVVNSLKSFNGKLELEDEAISSAFMDALMDEFTGTLCVTAKYTAEMLQVLNKKLVDFKGRLLLSDLKSPEQVALFNFDEYHGSIHLSSYSESIMKALIKKLKAFPGNLYYNKPQQEDTKTLDYLLEEYEGRFAISTFSRQQLKAFNADLPKFRGTLEFGLNVTEEQVADIELKEFRGVVRISDLTQELVSKIAAKLKTFTATLCFECGNDDPDLTFCSLEHFRGTLRLEKSYREAEIKILNQRLKEFYGTLELCGHHLELVKYLDFSEFCGTLRVMDGMEALVDVLPKKLKNFTGVLCLASQPPEDIFKKILKQYQGQISFAGISSKMITHLTGSGIDVKSILRIDERLTPREIEAMWLDKFNGTVAIVGLTNPSKIKALKLRLDAAICSVLFDGNLSVDLVRQLPQRVFKLKLTVGTISESVLCVLIEKCMAQKTKLLDLDGKDLVEEFRSRIAKKSSKKPVEPEVPKMVAPSKPQIVNNPEPKTERVVIKEKKPTRHEEETRKIQEKLEQKKMLKKAPEKEKIKKSQPEIIVPVLEKKEQKVEAKAPVEKSIWLSKIDPLQIPEFKPSRVIDTPGVFFEVKKQIQKPALGIKIMSTPDGCPDVLFDTIQYLHSGRDTICEFDAFFLLGRLIETIQVISDTPEGQDVRKKIVNIETLRSQLIHFGLLLPESVLIEITQGLYAATLATNDHRVDAFGLDYHKSLNKIQREVGECFNFRLKFDEFQQLLFSLIKAVAAASSGNTGLDERRSQDLVKYALCFLGELENHLPIALDNSFARYRTLIQTCRDRVTTVEYRITTAELLSCSIWGDAGRDPYGMESLLLLDRIYKQNDEVLQEDLLKLTELCCDLANSMDCNTQRPAF